MAQPSSSRPTSMNTASPFLNLPGEIRNNIYGHYLDQRDPTPDAEQLIGIRIRLPPLDRVCRLMREELRLLLPDVVRVPGRSTTLKAAVFDLHLDLARAPIERNSILTHAHVSLVLTRATTSMSSRSVERVKPKLQDFTDACNLRRCDRTVERCISAWHETYDSVLMRGISITYAVHFWPADLSFDARQLKDRLLPLKDAMQPAMWTAIESALDKRCAAAASPSLEGGAD